MEKFITEKTYDGSCALVLENDYCSPKQDTVTTSVVKNGIKLAIVLALIFLGLYVIKFWIKDNAKDNTITSFEVANVEAPHENCSLFTTLQGVKLTEEQITEYRKYHRYYSFVLIKQRFKMDAENRFDSFLNNVLHMEKERRRQYGANFEVNFFTDLHDDELQAYTMNAKFSSPYQVDRYSSNIPSQTPDEVDWNARGKVTPVENTGDCASSWISAALSVVESATAIKTNEPQTFSDHELMKGIKGCDGGKTYDVMNFVISYGLVPKKNDKKARVYVEDYRMLTSDEENIAQYLAQNGPVAAGLNVTRELFSYRSGIYSPSQEECQSSSMGYLAVTIVGYGVEAGQPFWLIKNSWGQNWGEKGYFKIRRGLNACGIANNVLAVVLLPRDTQNV